MKIFVIVIALALVGSSHGFIDSLATMFKNVGHELGEVGKDLLHAAKPLSTSLLDTLKTAGSNLITSAATNLLTHLGSVIGKRDLGEIIEKVESFIARGQQYLKETGTLLEGAFKGTVTQIHNEIQTVLEDVKPIENLVNEVKAAIEGHNNFVDNLISKAEHEGQKILGEIVHLIPHKRDLLGLGDGLKHLIEEVTNPIKGVLSGVVSSLEKNVLSLLG